MILEAPPIQAVIGIVLTLVAVTIALPSQVVIGNIKLKNKLSQTVVSYYRNAVLALRNDRVLNLTFHLQSVWGLILIGSTLYEKEDGILLISTMMISVLPIIKKILDQQEYLLDREVEDKILIAIGLMINISVLSNSLNYYSILLSILINLYCLSLVNAELKTTKWLESNITNIASKSGFSICLYSQMLIISKSDFFHFKSLENIIIGTIIFIIYLFVIELTITRSITRRITESAAHKRLILITIIILAVISYKVGGKLG